MDDDIQTAVHIGLPDFVQLIGETVDRAALIEKKAVFVSGQAPGCVFFGFGLRIEAEGIAGGKGILFHMKFCGQSFPDPFRHQVGIAGVVRL